MPVSSPNRTGSPDAGVAGWEQATGSAGHSCRYRLMLVAMCFLSPAAGGRSDLAKRAERLGNPLLALVQGGYLRRGRRSAAHAADRVSTVDGGQVFRLSRGRLCHLGDQRLAIERAVRGG